MKSNILYIILSFVLCFGFKAQAQITKVVSLEQMKTSTEGKSLTEVLQSPSLRLVFMEDQQPAYAGTEDGPVRIVDIQAVKNIDLLKSPTYVTALKTAEILVINLKLKEEKEILLQQEHLKNFANLKYIVVRSYDKLDEDHVRGLFKDLFSMDDPSKSIYLVYVTLEEAS